jgi:hypothetical protein
MLNLSREGIHQGRPDIEKFSTIEQQQQPLQSAIEAAMHFYIGGLRQPSPLHSGASASTGSESCVLASESLHCPSSPLRRSAREQPQQAPARPRARQGQAREPEPELKRAREPERGQEQRPERQARTDWRS